MICEKDLGEGGVDLGFVGRPVEVDPGVLRTLPRLGLHPRWWRRSARGGRRRDLQRQRRHRGGRDRGGDEGGPAAAPDRRHGVKDADGAMLTQLSSAEVRALIASGVIAGGMIPKTETALAAVEGGVRAAVILDGRAPHAVLLELFTAHGAGTLIRDTPPRTA
jgi:acetylglutamate kinase